MFRLWAIRWTATQHVGANISMQSPQDAFADLQRQLRDTSDPSRSASDNLRAACAAYLDFARSRSQRYRVMFGAVWNAEEALQRFPERSQDLTRLGLGAFGARRLRHRLRRPTGINERGLVRRRHRPLGRPARARGASRRHTSVPLAARPRGHPDHPSRASPIQLGTGPALRGGRSSPDGAERAILDRHTRTVRRGAVHEATPHGPARHVQLAPEDDAYDLVLGIASPRGASPSPKRQPRSPPGRHPETRASCRAALPCAHPPLWSSESGGTVPSLRAIRRSAYSAAQRVAST
jgi:hypothetical protein